jgi:PAS domain S-box-containing protein
LAGLRYSKPVATGSGIGIELDRCDAQAISNPPLALWLVTVGLAIIYFLAGKAGLFFASLQPNASAVWPPTGIALAASLLLGYRVWPAIFLGAFLVNATTAGSFATSLGIAAGNTLEAVAGAYLVNRFANGKNVFNRPRDVLSFTLLAAGAATALSATIGVTSLSLGGYASWSRFGAIWFTWWLGDAAGALVFVPLLVSWWVNPRLDCDRAQRYEGAVLLVLLVLFSGLVFGNVLPAAIQHRPIAFLCIPFLIWAAFRFGPRGAATANLVLTAIAIIGTLRGFGPFAWDVPNDALLLLLAFLGVLDLTAIAVAAGVEQRRSAEEARAGLAAIVDSSDDAIIGKTLDGRITSWNASAQRLFGYGAAEAVGKPISIIIPAERMDEGAQVLERLRRGDVIDLAETVRVSKDGRRVDISLAVSPIKDARGRIVGASSIARDISEHKRVIEALRASEEKFHQMADAVPDILFTSDSQGVIEYTNQRFYEYTGVPQGTAEQFRWAGAIHPDDMVAAAVEWPRLVAQGQPFQIEFRLRVADGSYRWFMSRAYPIRDGQGQVVKWYGSCTEIEEQKQAQEEREKLLRAEQKARFQAEAANRAKDEFLAMLGHELRNPLGAILTSMEILEHFGADARRAAKAREIMGRQLKHLVRLVDDLLDVARVTRGRIELRRQAVDLGENVKACVNALGERLSSHDVKVEVEPMWVNADPTRLEQIVTNLLRNAIEYTPVGGHIHVSVRAEGGNAVIRVEDGGAGIPPELLPRIFDLFVQDERGLDRSGGGLGIGLTLTRRLVELHDGTVEAASPGPGAGSVFTVRLPRLVMDPPSEPQTPNATRAANMRRRVLIVEDNFDARESLRTILELSGHEVFEAADGRGGIDQALALTPDVALIDIGLPGVDGYEVARQIRSTPAGRDIFLIALTGYGQPRDRDRAQQAGFDDHVVKPVDFGRLSELIAAVPDWPQAQSNAGQPWPQPRANSHKDKPLEGT